MAVNKLDARIAELRQYLDSYSKDIEVYLSEAQNAMQRREATFNDYIELKELQEQEQRILNDIRNGKLTVVRSDNMQPVKITLYTL